MVKWFVSVSASIAERISGISSSPADDFALAKQKWGLLNWLAPNWKNSTSPLSKKNRTFTLVQQRSVVSRLFELATHPPNCTIYLLYLLRSPTWYFRLRDACKSNLHRQVITSHFTRRKTTYTSVWILQRLVNAITLHRKRTEIKVSLAPKFAYSVVPIGNFISVCCRGRTSQITLFRT